MIGTHSTPQQRVAARMIRLAGTGAVGLLAVIGIVMSAVLHVSMRRTVGCIVEYGPEPWCSVVMVALACPVAALLACARTTTSALVGSLVLGGLCLAMAGMDDFAAGLGLVLAAAMVTAAVTAKCIEEFPAACTETAD